MELVLLVVDAVGAVYGGLIANYTNDTSHRSV